MTADLDRLAAQIPLSRRGKQQVEKARETLAPIAHRSWGYSTPPVASSRVPWPRVSRPPERINVEGLGRLPVFSHASRAEGWIFVSGTLGTRPGGFELVEGGVGPETAQTLRNLERILAAAGAGWRDVVKVSVYVADMAGFGEMNRAYAEFFHDQDPPARITVGGVALALGAAVEIECVAWRPEPGA